MENKFIRLVGPDICLSSQAAEYYKRNRRFLEEFEPVRKESFFTEEYILIVLPSVIGTLIS